MEDLIDFPPVESDTSVPDPVMEAVGAGEAGSLKKLIEQGFDCKIKDRDGFTPMHQAAKRGHLECVELLLKAAWNDYSSANEILQSVCPPFDIIEIRSTSGECRVPCTPLSLAAEKGHWEIVNVLSVLYTDLSAERTGYALCRASDRCRIKCIEILVNKFPDHLNERDFRHCLPIHAVAHSGSSEAMLILLKKSNEKNINSIDAGGCTPLHYAAQSGNLDLVQMLLKEGSDPSIKDLGHMSVVATPLTIAVVFRRFEVVKFLTDLTPPDCGAIFEAAYSEDIKCLIYLLKNGFPLFDESFKAHLGRNPWNSMLFDGPNWYTDMSATVRILLDKGVRFKQMATSKRFSIFPSGLDFLHPRTLEVFLEYGLAELRNDSQCSPDFGAFKNFVREALVDFYHELATRVQQLQGEDNFPGIFHEDSTFLLSNLNVYLKFFPFAKFSTEQSLSLQSFDESIVPKCPTLAERCRWALRSCITSKHGILLPEHVAGFPLPNALKRFLLYK